MIRIPVDTPWAIVGRGRMGTALGALADRLGVTVAVTWQRGDSPLSQIGSGLEGAAVFLAVRDDAIEDVARALAPQLNRANVVVHCSGSLSSGVLRESGVTCPTGSVHPLLAIADPEEAVARMAGCAWTIEGDSQSLEWARGWLALLGVEPTVIAAEHKTLYHAAAVSSAGLVVGLMDAAFAIAAGAGISAADARAMLLPLARSTLDNLEGSSTADALTGPVARGDEATIEAHRAAIAALGDASLLEIYDALTGRTRGL